MGAPPPFHGAHASLPTPHTLALFSSITSSTSLYITRDCSSHYYSCLRCCLGRETGPLFYFILKQYVALLFLFTSLYSSPFQYPIMCEFDLLISLFWLEFW